MIVHQDVLNAIQTLQWQIAAWKQIQERHPEEKSVVKYQIEQCECRIEELSKKDSEVWVRG